MNEICLRAFVETIASENRKQQFEAIRSFWRMGDAVCALRDDCPCKGWLKVLDGCAKRLGMHPASLDEARRASEAFPPAAREAILARFDERKASLTPSHVVVLARAAPTVRNRGIEILLEKPLSVRQLRNELRAASRDGHRSGSASLAPSLDGVSSGLAARSAGVSGLPVF